jgi:hypothetical protein
MKQNHLELKSVTPPRPWVVISPDEMNRHLRTVVVAPMTTRSRLLPTRVRVRHNKQTGWIVVDPETEAGNKGNVCGLSNRATGYLKLKAHAVNVDDGDMLVNG